MFLIRVIILIILAAINGVCQEVLSKRYIHFGSNSSGFYIANRIVTDIQGFQKDIFIQPKVKISHWEFNHHFKISDENLEHLEIANSEFNSGIFVGISKPLDLILINSNVRKKFYTDYTSSIKNLLVQNSDLAYSDFESDTLINSIRFSSTKFFGQLTFSKCLVKQAPKFESCELPTVLNLNGLVILGKDELLDLRRTFVSEAEKKFGDGKCSIYLGNFDYTKLILPYDLFRLAVDSTTSYEKIQSIYQILTKNCKDAGLLESAKNWDIEYQKTKNCKEWGYEPGWRLNWWNIHWWNFGYEKWRILVYWLPGLFIFFVFVNMCIICQLNEKVYSDTDFKYTKFKNKLSSNKIRKINFWSRLAFRFKFTFFYTASIYFGFKIKHSVLNYNNFIGMVYIYSIYIVGTIHLAFSLSYILSVY